MINQWNCDRWRGICDSLIVEFITFDTYFFFRWGAFGLEIFDCIVVAGRWHLIDRQLPTCLLTVKCISSSSSQHIEQSPSAVRRWNGMKWATPYDVLLESFLPGPSPGALCVVTVIISLHVAYIQWETDKAGREKERKRMEKRIGDGDAPPVPYSKFDDADDSQQMFFSQRTTTQGPERHQLGDEAAFLFFLSCTVYRPTHTHTSGPTPSLLFSLKSKSFIKVD